MTKGTQWFSAAMAEWCCAFITHGISSSRQKMWGGAGRFHRIHRIPKLPRQLPGQHWVYVDHQPAPQAPHLDCGPWDLPAYRGWLWRLPGDAENLCVLPLCSPPLPGPAGKPDDMPPTTQLSMWEPDLEYHLCIRIEMSHKFLEFAKKQNLDKNHTLRPLAEPQWDSCRSVFALCLLGTFFHKDTENWWSSCMAGPGHLPHSRN